ncbi:MAG: 3'-phosphoadenosine 5'-phosphosulfate sulfotransferase [Claussenomyces sp. TS43310]|nr:MAG: 3'-phosphoadenosine 5'-phosphosulfate sulfotransferase [Claussenomyces sp. TS43310]
MPVSIPGPPTHNAASADMNQGTQDDGLRPLCDALAEQVRGFLASEPETAMLKAVQRQTRIALGVIDAALERYTFEEISISYNGGKDCLVLLILFLVSLSNRAAATGKVLPRRLQSVYIISAHPFAEVDSFVESSTQTYQLDLTRYAMPMKEGFARYLDDKQNQGCEVKAIFVGTRRTDPHGALLTHFDQTDKGWPAFMRVHPVIDWHYAEIWAVSYNSFSFSYDG